MTNICFSQFESLEAQDQGVSDPVSVERLLPFQVHLLAVSSHREKERGDSLDVFFFIHKGTSLSMMTLPS